MCIRDRSEYDVSPLTYLESYSESERQKMLTANGETWTVLFHICPEDAESDYIWSKYPEVKTWLTNLEDVELYFPASGDWNEKKPYVRSLISIFTPGAEDYVISKLSLSAKFRVTSSVIVDNVVYTLSLIHIFPSGSVIIVHLAFTVMYSYRCFIIIFLSGLSACHIWIISSA